MPYILCVEGANSGEEWYVGTSSVMLGRSKEVEVTVLDTKASREHARIFFRGGEHFIEDLGSTNGTYVEHQKIEKPTLLKEENFFQVGQTLFLFSKTSLRERAGQLAHVVQDDLMERPELRKTALTGALHDMVQDVVAKKRVHIRHNKKIRPGSFRWMLQGLTAKEKSEEEKAGKKGEISRSSART